MYRAILRRGFAFSASIKNPPLLKSRNIQSQASVTANLPLFGSTNQSIIASSPQASCEQSGIQIKDTSKLHQYHHTSTTSAPMATAGIAEVTAAAATASISTKQVRQKHSKESEHDLPSCSSHSQHNKNEHIV